MPRPRKGKNADVKIKSRFNQDWLLDTRFKPWLLRHPTDTTKALCKICNNKPILVRSSGVSALISHMRQHTNDQVKDALTTPMLNFTESRSNKETPMRAACKRSSIVCAAEPPIKKASNDQPDLLDQGSSSVEVEVVDDNALSGETPPTSSLIQASSADTLISSEVTVEEIVTTKSNTLDSFFKKSNVTSRDSEIRWTLKVIVSHYSYNSCQNISDLFKAMFPDSAIAAQFKLGRSKCSYLINYGISPVIKAKVVRSIKTSPFHTVMYDESLNKVNQDCQMDIQVRFWDDNAGMAVSRYLDSKFLKNPNAENQLDCLLEATEALEGAKLIHLSMDGPNVNWKVLNLLNEDRTKNNLKELFNLGSCSLHIVNGAFKYGFDCGTTWEIKKILNAMYKFFYDAPARRGNYIRESNSNIFPKRFFSVRWVENDEVAERAIEVWENVCKTIKWYMNLVPSKQPKKNKQFEVLVKYNKNNLIIAHLNFFRDVAEILNGYLVLMQTDKPMVPFLCDKLLEALRKLMCIIFSRDTIDEKASTPYQFNKLDLNDDSHYLPDTNVKLPTGTSLASRSLSDAEKLCLKKEAKKAIRTLLEKLLEKNPMSHSLNRAAACIAPEHLAKSGKRKKIVAWFRGIVDLLYQRGLFLRGEADSAKEEYETFLRLVDQNREKFLEFDIIKDRLDVFLGGFLHHNPKYSNLWKVMKFIFTLSHGQAVVERGFNINSDVVVENLADKSLIAQRLIYDELKSTSSEPRTYPITNELRKSCLTAYNRYEAERQQKKKEEAKTEKQKKGERIQEEISSVSRQIQSVNSTIESLQKQSEKCYDDAEKKPEGEAMALLATGNGLRKTIKEKKSLVQSLEQSIQHLKDELKNL